MSGRAYVALSRLPGSRRQTVMRSSIQTSTLMCFAIMFTARALAVANGPAVRSVRVISLAKFENSSSGFQIGFSINFWAKSAVNSLSIEKRPGAADDPNGNLKSM